MAVSRQAKRRLAYGGNATLVSAIAVAVAVVLYLLADLYRVRVDLSADQGSVLMADTRKKLALLDTAGTPVVITAFSAQSGKKEAAVKNRALSDLLDELDYPSTRVETHFVDFDRERLTAERLGVTEYGTMVIQRGEQRIDLRDRDLFRRKGKKDDNTFDFLGESAVARAFAQLMSDEQRVVYALVGHGEPMVEATGPDGLADLGKLLDGDGYKLQALDLQRGTGDGAVPRVPDDASAVLVLRPTVALPPIEEDLLLAYLATGGSLLVAVEPEGVAPGVLGRMGVSIPSGRVMDELLVFPYPDRPIPRYKGHPITRDLADAQMVTELGGVAPVVTASPALEGVRASTVLETTRDGWIERGGELQGGKATFDPGVDEKGPVAMAAALELGQDSGLVRRGVARVLVVGDADCLTNAILGEGPGNATFAVNAVRWLVRDEARLSAVGRPSSSRRLALTDTDKFTILALAMGVGPGLVALGGVVVWMSRRGR